MFVAILQWACMVVFLMVLVEDLRKRRSAAIKFSIATFVLVLILLVVDCIHHNLARWLIDSFVLVALAVYTRELLVQRRSRNQSLSTEGE
ncbi:MAG: hypothetical protein ABIR37_02875 [Candidatus Saccharimonadales bacterium]